MAVSIGNQITAANFNTLRSEVNRWFADNYAGGIAFGNANQTYGWGGSAAAVASAGNVILASDMNTLIDRCNIGTNICNVVTGQITRVITGNRAYASEFNNTETKSDLITTNRLNIDTLETSLSTVGSNAKATVWGAAIDATIRYTFTSFDKARYFFNSGGALSCYATISGYSSGTGWDGAGFNAIFTTMGNVSMNYTATVQSGSGGTPSAIGYYDLTTSFVNIFSQTGTGVYTDATLFIAAKINASGTEVEIRYTLTPGAGRSVNGTTTFYNQRRKLDNQNSGGQTLTITAPSYSVIDGF